MPGQVALEEHIKTLNRGATGGSLGPPVCGIASVLNREGIGGGQVLNFSDLAELQS
jgi:hypothetical protein